MLPDEVEAALLQDLEPLCRVRVISDCSAVSLVGRKIRTIIPRLAPALEVFEEERIHLMSQAANDLNLSFVVDRQQGPRPSADDPEPHAVAAGVDPDDHEGVPSRELPHRHGYRIAPR